MECPKVFGERDVRCEQGHNLPDVVLSCRPGTLYFGSMTGPRHQVQHRKSGTPLWQDPRPEGERPQPKSGGSGLYAVTVQARTGFFPHCRSHTRDTTPAPWDGFEAIVTNIREGLERMPFRLPTMAEVLQAEALELDRAAASPPAKRAKVTET